MATTVEQLNEAIAVVNSEDAKFVAGNAAASTRARKALAEASKLIKQRRNEITAEKNARKEAKA